MYTNIEDQRACSRAHYRNNKDMYLRKNVARRRRLYDTVIVKEKDKPCADCGHSFPTCCMDFDHVRGKKSFDIASNVTSSTEKLIAEIAKCDVVCANCHRIRTHNRQQRSG